jgi:hypothetical protein
MGSLDSISSFQNILTLSEAILRLKDNKESEMYHLMIKKKDTNMTPGLISSKNSEKIIKIRKHKVEIDGSLKTLVMIRDFSDIIKYEQVVQQ